MGESMYQYQYPSCGGGGGHPKAKDTALDNKFSSSDIWGIEDCVNSMQKIWERIPASSSRDKLRKSSTGSSGDSSVDEDRASPPANLTIEQKRAGRILMTGVFNGLEYLEMDRISYASKVGIPPAPFRELFRAVELDVPSVLAMLTESKRHFELHILFVKAMHEHLMKMRKEKKDKARKKPATEQEIFWYKMFHEANKARKQRGEPMADDVLLTPKEQKQVKDHQANIDFIEHNNRQWVRDWKQIQQKIADPALCKAAQLKNLELMPFHMEKLITILDAARFGIYALFCEIMFEMGKAPDLDVDVKSFPRSEPEVPKGPQFRWYDTLAPSQQHSQKATECEWYY